MVELSGPKGRKHIARGEALGAGKNNKITAQKGRKEFVVAGTFTFLGIHFRKNLLISSRNMVLNTMKIISGNN